MTQSGPENKSLEWLAKWFKNKNFNKFKVLHLNLSYIQMRHRGGILKNGFIKYFAWSHYLGGVQRHSLTNASSYNFCLIP